MGLNGVTPKKCAGSWQLRNLPSIPQAQQQRPICGRVRGWGVRHLHSIGLAEQIVWERSRVCLGGGEQRLCSSRDTTRLDQGLQELQGVPFCCSWSTRQGSDTSTCDSHLKGAGIMAVISKLTSKLILLDFYLPYMFGSELSPTPVLGPSGFHGPCRHLRTSCPCTPPNHTAGETGT
jgi:hypothetical protein